MSLDVAGLDSGILGLINTAAGFVLALSLAAWRYVSVRLRRLVATTDNH
jgi:hypothetical protein